MNTRRIPFQFSTTDPLARQRELEKRFGLQSSRPNMYVDVNNSLPMGTITKETSSPRLQHRVPIFAEGYDQHIHSSSVDSMASVSDNKKPNVRVIPIEFEGTDSRSPRHRTYSGPADTLKDRCNNLASDRIERFPFKKCSFQDSSKPKLNAEPRVFNIPIQIEDDNNVSRNFEPNFASMSQKPKFNETPIPKSAAPTTNNGCSQSKSPSKVKSLKKDNKVQPESNENKANQTKSNVEISLKKVEDVLVEFKRYETEVVEFTGTSKDKQYRYLDEMLTRCMLRLDDIDTLGNEEIRLARKNAVKKVQASIDLLESKANVEPITSSKIAQIQSSAVTSTENDTNSELKEMDLTLSDKENQNKVSNTVVSSSAEIETKSKVESAKVTFESTNNVTDVEMSEIKQDQESSTSSVEQPQSKMTEEVFHKVNSTCDVQSSELLGSNNESTVQNEVTLKTVTNDFDMLDNLTSIIVKESSPLKETSESISDVNKSSEVSEVEMVDVQDISRKKYEALEKSVKNNSEQNTSKELDLDDTVSPKDDSNTLDCVNHKNGDECIPDLPELDIKCVSSQSEGF